MTQTAPAPDRQLPLLYLGFAHLCLLAACLALVLAPRAIAGFYYHPKMVAMVHLVTLGWISSSILGALLMLGPMTLGIAYPRRRFDRWAFWLFVTGTSGMVTHFWIDEPTGMVWAAPLVLTGLLSVGLRAAGGLRASRLPAEIRLHFYFAVVNIALAGTLGFLVGLDKLTEVLPGRSLSNVFGHGHLAALGWVLMLVMGAGYRLIPMFLPSSMPRGGAIWASALVLQAGVLGLAAGFLWRPSWIPFAGLVCVAAVALFLSRIVWMLRHRKPPAPHLPRTNLTAVQIFSALTSLLAAAALGTLLVTTPDAEWKTRAILAYATLGLLGFFGQMVAAMGGRLVPLYAYLAAPREPDAAAYQRPTPPPRLLASRPLEVAVCGLWLVGIPLLAASLAFDWIPWLRLSGALLGGAVAAGLAAHIRALRRAGWGWRG